MSHLTENDLTDVMKEKIPEFHKTWLRNCRNTEPLSIDDAKAAVIKCYTDAGKTLPLKFVYSSSNISLYIIYKYYEKLFVTDPDSKFVIPFEDFREIPIKNIVNAIVLMELSEEKKINVPNFKIRPRNWKSIIVSNAIHEDFIKDTNNCESEIIGPKWDEFVFINSTEKPINIFELCDKIDMDVFLEKKRQIVNSLSEYTDNTHYGYHQSHSAFILDYIKAAVMPNVTSERMKELSDYYKMDSINGFMEACQKAGWMLFGDQVAFISDRYCELHLEPPRSTDGVPESNHHLHAENRRFHNPNGPAVLFRDGLKIYSIKGIRVPAKIIEEPQNITAKDVLECSNAEVRRLMVEKMGDEKFIKEAGAKMIDSYNDTRGNPVELYKAEFEDDEPLTILKLIDSTPGQDGIAKVYYLRVPPNEECDPGFIESMVDGVLTKFPSRFPVKGEMLRAKQARAWLGDKDEESYNPEIET